MSKKSMGVGEGFVVAALAFASAGTVVVPRALRMVDRWGSFFAFYVDPSTKTNLFSSSYAIYCKACSLVASSTLTVSS